jgi:hypothetical protein
MARFGGCTFRLVCLVSLLSMLAGEVRAAVPPVDLTLNSATVREGQPAGTIVGILKAVDPDPGDSHTFALVSGEGADDNALFATSADTLRTAAVLNYTTHDRFRIRLREQDGIGYSFEKPFTITVTPPSFVNALQNYFVANPAVSNASLAMFDQATLDFFWVYQNCLAARGTIAMDVPVNTPADTATNGTGTVYLSATETARIHGAKAAQAVWLDLNEKVPWRLRDYAPAHLAGLFARTNLFNPQSSSVFYFLSVVDYSPTEAWQYVRDHGLLRPTVVETIYAVLDDLRSDFLHGSASLGDPACAYRLQHALSYYSPTRFRPARIARSGCHSSSRIALALLRSGNIPGYETAIGDYFLNGHSEAVFPCVGQVLPHGDHVYSADLTATPVEKLMPTFQFIQDNLLTPPCAGSTYRVAVRHQAINGIAYPTPTMLGGVRNPASYGYASAVEFLNGYAGWGQGLTTAELNLAASNLLANFNETRHLTIATTTAQGYVINNPAVSDYPTNSRVSLKALPQAGHIFSHWTGDVPPGQETANPLLLTMTADKVISAVFTRPPATASIAKLPDGQAQIFFTALSNLTYTIEYRDDLGAGSWHTLTNVPAQPATVVATNTDPVRPNPGQRFYRIVTH